MLTAYFKSASTIARYRAGSAGSHIDRFVDWLVDQGYRRTSIRRHVREVVNFAAWAESGGLGTATLNHDALTQLHDHLTTRGRQRDPAGEVQKPSYSPQNADNCAHDQARIALRATRAQLRIALESGMAPVRRRGELQDLLDNPGRSRRR